MMLLSKILWMHYQETRRAARVKVAGMGGEEAGKFLTEVERWGVDANRTRQLDPDKYSTQLTTTFTQNWAESR